MPYDAAEEGGVKRHAYHLAESLRRGGDEVTVIGPLSRGEGGAGFRGFGGVVNIPANGAANYLALLTPPTAVRRFFRASDFDVVHIHEPLVPMLPYYALWFSPRAAHVCTFHMYVEREGFVSRAVRRVIAGVLLRGFERGIAVSAPAAELAGRSWGRPLSVIANGVPTSTFTPSQRAEHAPTPEAPLRLLFVGHWRDPRKGLAFLLEACDRLRAQGLPICLDVVGAGETPAPRPAVTFHGPVASEVLLAEHYRRCDLFVAPSTGQESFGIVLLEAMACGRPLVCSDIPGYRQVVDESGARLVAPGEPEQLAAAIGELAVRPELRSQMGALNRLRSAEYDWDRLAGRVREEYVAALAIRQRSPAPAQILESAP
jgi:phosphatidylinositol alpha-mannosyltransferase